MNDRHVTGSRLKRLLCLAIVVLVSGLSAPPTLRAQDPVPPFWKEFSRDPAAPGDTMDLTFSILNSDRSNPATGITFSDDLDAALTGLEASGTPQNDVCGAGSTLSGTSLLTLTGGNLAAGERCEFAVTVQVPAAAASGTYTNTTSALTSDAGPMADAAQDTLTVAPFPSLSLAFQDERIVSGDMTTLSFTLENASDSYAATGITFNLPLGETLPGTTALSLPATDVCGAGSFLFATTLPPSTYGLQLFSGNLPPAGSCSFDVTLQTPPDLPNNVYTVTSSAPEATVDGATVQGYPASDDLTVVAGPQLVKSFVSGPVIAGETTTLQFTLTHSENAPGDATGITFTDDLDAALSGLTAVGLPANDVCGTGSQISGSSLLTFTGGAVSPNSSCTFTVTLQAPAGAAPGAYTNTTSDVSSTVDGLAVTGPAASADLQIAGLVASKEFVDDPVVPGGAMTLRFTLQNVSETELATDITFTDNLDEALSGMTATGLPLNDICGAGSSLSGTSLLTFAGGNLAPETSCTFDVTVQTPIDAAVGEYHNVTSSVSATVGGSTVVFNPATDDFTLLAPLGFSKRFGDEAVMPGGETTLTFTLSNTDAVNAITALTFSDDLDAALAGLQALGLPANDVCGAGSQLSGSSVLALTGGVLPASSTCTFSTTLQLPAGVPAGATVANTTSVLTGTRAGNPESAAPATDVLDVRAGLLEKAFSGPVDPGEIVTLTFSISNLDAVSDLNGLSFVDDLNAAAPGLTALGLPASDVCGAGSQLSGSTELALRDGALSAGSSCTFDVTLQTPAALAPGDYLNSTSDLFANGFAIGAPATATLIVTVPPTFDKAFAPETIMVGDTSRLTLTIDNSSNTVAASNLQFVDNLPAGLVVADPPHATTTCSGGALSAAPGSGLISYGGGSVAAGAGCTVAVDVLGQAPGLHNNTSGALTSSLGSSGAASATLDVDELPGLALGLAAQPPSVPEPGSTVTFTLSMTNTNVLETVTVTSLVDDVAGNLDGQGSCQTPQALVHGASYSCHYVVAVNGNAGTVQTHTATADGADDDGDDVQVQGSATVTVQDVLPTMDVSLLASTDTIVAPSQPVTFTLRVTNTGSAEALSLVSLEDDALGDLDGAGSCTYPQVIGPGTTYLCVYRALLLGEAGEPYQNRMTATAADDDGNEISESDITRFAVHARYHFPLILINGSLD